MFFDRGYFGATRHPVMCSIYILAILLCYEAGVTYCQHGDDLPWRTGLDAGWRYQLRQSSMPWLEWVPCGSLVVALSIWSLLRYKDMPREWLATLSGMVLESFLLALPLLVAARAVGLLVGSSMSSMLADSSRWAGILGSLGAGVYEEIVFRLMLVPVLLAVSRLLGLRRVLQVVLALVLAGVLFALAHHIPPFREPFRQELFIFRTVAGTYFGLVYRFRGIGIAVGAHTCYDLLATT